MINRALSNGSTRLVVVILGLLLIGGGIGFIVWQKQQSNTVEVDPLTEGYAAWKTYTSPRDAYSIKYPSSWTLINETLSTGASIRNFDPTSRPAEDPSNNKNYPKGYINITLSKLGAEDSMTPDTTARQWYEKLGKSDVSGYAPEFIHSAKSVSDYTLNGMAAKKTTTASTELTEDIFLLKNNSLYHLSLYPNKVTDNAVVKKILASFVATE